MNDNTTKVAPELPPRHAPVYGGEGTSYPVDTKAPPPQSVPVADTYGAPSTALPAEDNPHRMMDSREKGARGAWNFVHGAGEVIRGTFNDAMDRGGDMVAGRTAGTVASRQENPASVTEQGRLEMRQGVERMGTRKRN